MKINVPVRLRNPWFWIGIASVILSAMGISPETLTSWDLVFSAIVNLLSNPFQIGCVVVAVLGIFIDPTTAGLGDSNRALGYTKPFKEHK